MQQKTALHLLRSAVLYATQIAGSGKTARLAQQSCFAMEQKKGARTMGCNCKDNIPGIKKKVSVNVRKIVV